MTIVLFSACKKSENTEQSQPATSVPVTGQPNPVGSPSAPPTTANAPETKAKTDACALLTSSEIESIQKEAVKETKLSGSSQGGFSVSQCFFTLPTFTRSISLQVTERGDGSVGRDPREFWRETFHRQRESEKEREGKKKGREEEEERDSAPSLKVTGVGDEAFWVGSRVGGGLYVLKGNSYIRVAVGSAGSPNDQIQRSKELAQKVAARL